jgi:uncharacterized membrane protein YtjA (UPF0391 family)
MFSGAIISLIIAVLAAVVSYGGVPNATAAATAQHIYLIAIGLFVVSAMATILDLELPHGVRIVSTGRKATERTSQPDPGMQPKQAM